MGKENTDGGKTPALRTLYVRCTEPAHIDELVEGVRGIFTAHGIKFGYDPKQDYLPSVATVIIRYDGTQQKNLEQELSKLPYVGSISVASEIKIPENTQPT